MPREIKTTIAVDGEAAFKRSINEANTSIRNLGTQLTLAQAQFKKDGDAMKLMETRSKALKGEIGQQEEIVKALEKAVNDSAKAFGENSEKTEKWQAELNRAKAKLANLQSELTLNDAGLDRNGKSFDEASQKAADYQATLKTIGKDVSFKAVSDGISGITGVVGGAITKVLGFARAIRETFADAGEWADELSEKSTEYKMDVETLQRWQQAADFIDTDVETIIGARDKLGKKMVNGWKNGDMDMWEFLGIDMKDANGQWRDKMDVMWEVGETLMNMATIDGNDVRADEYAMEVFGKSWRELLPLFTAGREEWEKLVAEQQVVSEDRVKALGELDDANKALENSWDVTKYSFLAELAPVITDVTNAMTEMLKQFNEWMDTDEGKKAMQDLSDAVRNLFSGLTEIKFSDVIQTVKDALNSIKSVLQWLANHKNSIFNALKYIAGGFALLKVSDTVLRFMSLKNGLGGLFGGGSGGGTGATSGVNTAVTGGGTALAGTGGTAATSTGFFAKLGLAASKFTAEGAVGTLSGVAWPLAVAAAIMVPHAFQKSFEQQKIKQQQEREAAAQELLAAGDVENAELLAGVAEATGPQKNANGGYKHDVTGLYLDFNPTESIEDQLKGIRGRSKESKEALFADINQYAPYTRGEYTVDLLQKYWQMWDEIDQYGYSNIAIDPGMENAMLQNIGDAVMYASRARASRKNSEQDIPQNGNVINDALAEIKVNTQSTKEAAESISQMDLKKFNQLPDSISANAAKGVRQGINGLKIQIDGKDAGKILAPYIGEELGAAAQ